MSMSDPIADLLTRVRNASKAKHRYTDVPFSNVKEGVVKILKEQGFVKDYFVKRDGHKVRMRIFLKYSKTRDGIIQGLKRVSKPGLRRYVRHNSIPKVSGGMGISIISTSKGILDGANARDKKVGGELICYVW